MRMTRAPASFRSIALPGVLAAAAVALALGLLSAVPSPASGAAPERPQASPDDRAFCRHGLPPSGEALHRAHATDRSVGPRHAEPVALLLPRPGTAGARLTSWLTLLRGGLP